MKPWEYADIIYDEGEEFKISEISLIWRAKSDLFKIHQILT
jgi:hypothetical protein